MAKMGTYKARKKRAEPRSKDTVLVTLRKVKTETWIGIRRIALQQGKHAWEVVNDALDAHVRNHP